MYFVMFLRYLRGYIKFTVSENGGSAERFLNLCAHHSVSIWRMVKREDCCGGYTSVRGYRKMRSLARKAGVRLRVGERHGAPFVAHRYRRRWGIAAGAALFAILLVVSQQFVWAVRVEGCEQLEPRVLLSALEELGVKRGARISTIDARDVRQLITLRIGALSWATLNLQGTTATLVIRERTPPPPKVDTNIPANVVAARDGQIMRMEVTDGRSLCKKGDVVARGDLLVSGVNEDRWGLTHLIRANARIVAHVPETLEVAIPLQQETVTLTGKVLKRHYINLFGARLPLFIYRGVEGTYKLERMTTMPTVLGTAMPFTVTRESYLFYERGEERISEETALRLARRELARSETTLWGENLLSANYRASTVDNVLTLCGDYLVEQDIAKQVEIPLFDRKEQAKAKPPREGGY